MESLVTKLVQKFGRSNLPFEEFATEVAETTLIYLARDRYNEFADAIFSVDWSQFINEREGKQIAMSAVLEDGKRVEEDHIKFMHSLSYTDHDHSKDSFYILMCALRFRYPSFDNVKYRWFCKFLETIVFREHYRAEHHHPEYELYVDGGECTLEDVDETAYDRMARNFQFSENGMGNVELMEKFKPKWIRNNERNVKRYDYIVNRDYERVGKLWREFQSDKSNFEKTNL